MEVKFGTDGWRGIIADDFTIANLRRVSAAVAAYLQEQAIAGKGVVIGHDTRFLAESFAACVADVFTSKGITVHMATGATPTPVIAYSILAKRAAGAVMLTASHNPPEYNGFKFIPEYAGPALPEVTDWITSLIPDIMEVVPGNPQLLAPFDPRPEYYKFLARQVDLEKVGKLQSVVVNPMHGAGIGYLEEIFSGLGISVLSQGNWRDPLFGGKMPEPKPELLEDLLQAVLTGQGQLGLAMDGDGDRFGIIDAEGVYITPNQVLCILADYLLSVRGLRGPLARTVSTTGMLDRIAAHYGVELIETPVGFKYLGQALRERGAILAGEESGGLSIKGHIPEKDGILACLLMAEVTAHYGMPLSRIMESLCAKFGRVYNQRLDFRCPQSEKVVILSKLMGYRPNHISGLEVVAISDVDGRKFLVSDGSWVLVRPSGTEAVFRVYGEADDMQKLVAIQQEVAQNLGLQ